jgi:hypothetical protein
MIEEKPTKTKNEFRLYQYGGVPTDYVVRKQLSPKQLEMIEKAYKG